MSTKQFFAYVKDKLKHHKLSNAEKVQFTVEKEKLHAQELKYKCNSKANRMLIDFRNLTSNCDFCVTKRLSPRIQWAPPRP